MRFNFLEWLTYYNPLTQIKIITKEGFVYTEKQVSAGNYEMTLTDILFTTP